MNDSVPDLFGWAQSAKPAEEIGFSEERRPQAKTVAPAAGKSPVIAVQQFLLQHNLPIKPAAQTPIAEQQPDGGWGPVSNGSLNDFVETNLQSTGPQADQYRELASKLEPLVKDDPKQTLANIGKIFELTSGFQSGAAAKPASTPSKGQEGSGIKQKERAPIFWTVTIKDSPNPSLNKTYENVLINARTLENADYLEQLLMYKGMIDPGARGKERAEQVRAAVNGIIATLPDKFPGAKYVAEMLGREIQQKALEAAKNMHVKDYLVNRFRDKLSKMPEPTQQTALHVGEDILYRQNVLDENGYLKYRGAPIPYEPEIERRFDNLMRRIGT